MNIVELRDTLRKKSEKELSDFAEAFGGGLKDPLKIERTFVDHPEYERRMCHLLGLKTEEEKRTQAAFETAQAAFETAQAAFETAKGAKCAAIAASISALISLIIFLITILKK